MALIARDPAAVASKSDKKLKELILYIALCCQSDDRFGAVKLNKILFYADFTAYLTLGESITGTEYFALPEGPAPRRMKPIREEMREQNEIVIQEIAKPGLPNPQHRIIALRQPDLSGFRGDHIALVDQLIRRFWLETGTDLSKHSHGFLGWQTARREETIPYSVAAFDAQHFTETDEDGDLPPEIVTYAHSLEPLALRALGYV
jgi:hypothetical protein